jgi:hypothetical protein
MSDIGGDTQTLLELEAKCNLLRKEIFDVINELDIPKVSDQCLNE